MRARKSRPASVSVYRARSPDEKRDTDFALKRRDRPRRGRLRNVQLTTGRESSLCERPERTAAEQ